MPIGSFVPAGHSEDETGTISNEQFSNFLVGEDWQRARGALASALDPQGSGSVVHWNNPNSGVKGSFAAYGKSYPSEAGICRAFVADIDRKNAEDALQGTACADKGGEWTVTDVKSMRKS
jgi:surface antigen